MNKSKYDLHLGGSSGKNSQGFQIMEGFQKPNKKFKQIQVVPHEVIDIDEDDDEAVVWIIDEEEVDKGSKGKSISMGYDKNWTNGGVKIAIDQKKPTAMSGSTVPCQSSSKRKKEEEEPEALKKFKMFKQFDIVLDFSDHHFIRQGQGSNSKRAPLHWSKKIQDEWKILKKDLPDSIFVRVYEERMDLLRAVIVGAAGTPYHDGLFFFDVFFPSSYPNAPPNVYYYSRGHRLNPNLYNCGRVCLSLLNTWKGNKNEHWIPGKSTMLQVLLSIQALVLNAKPYFNEPGYEGLAGTKEGEKYSQEYNERTFILSSKTMLHTIRSPPKHFEDFVAGYFRERALVILVACKAYSEGAQVGCLAEGGVQDVDEGQTSCSPYFKMEVQSIIQSFVEAFKKNGSTDCEQFLPMKVYSMRTFSYNTHGRF